jgi:DNA-binding MarR family transcriptional regulator
MEITLGRQLFLTHRVVHDELDRRLAQHGASIWKWILLREAANGDGLSQRELADLMRIEPPTLVRHLDKLTSEGLVERSPDPDDRRVTHVLVTPAGHERLEEWHAVVQGLDVELRGILTKRETEVLTRALPRIRAYFERQEQEQKEVADAR